MDEQQQPEIVPPATPKDVPSQMPESGPTSPDPAVITPMEPPTTPAVLSETSTPVAAEPERPAPSAMEPTPGASTPSTPEKDFREIVRAAKRKNIESRLEKIVVFARERGRIANRDIEKHLNVSDATATRYARMLVTRGILKKTGNTKGAYYELM